MHHDHHSIFVYLQQYLRSSTSRSAWEEWKISEDFGLSAAAAAEMIADRGRGLLSPSPCYLLLLANLHRNERCLAIKLGRPGLGREPVGWCTGRFCASPEHSPPSTSVNTNTTVSFTGTQLHSVV